MDTSTRGPGRQFSSGPRSQAREHASTVNHSVSATETLKRHQRSIAEDRYLSDSHARVHRVFTGRQHCYQRWQWDWSRDQCITVAEVRTGHSLLAAAYLHRIGRRDSAICPHCHGAEETVEYLVFGRPTDPRRPWSYLERIGAESPPPADREWKRETCRRRKRLEV